MTHGLISLVRWMVFTWALLLIGCGGGGSSVGSSANPPRTLPDTDTIYGVAATGAAIRGTITLKDAATGQVLSTHTDTGDYSFNVTGMKGPFLLSAVSDDFTTRLYSMAFPAGRHTRANINPLSNLIVVRAGVAVTTEWFSPHEIFDQPSAFSAITPTVLLKATRDTLANTSPEFRSALRDKGLSIDRLNPITDTFTIGQGLDQVFDKIAIHYDSVASAMWEVDTASNTNLGGSYVFQRNRTLVGLRIEEGEGLYLMEGGTLNLTATALWSDGSISFAFGTKWQLPDGQQFQLSQNQLYAEKISGWQDVELRAVYQMGDQAVHASATLHLFDAAKLDSVDLAAIPETLESLAELPLMATLHFTTPQGSFSNLSSNGEWSVEVPDEATLPLVQFEEQAPLRLMIGKLPQDTEVTLHWQGEYQGRTYTTDRKILLKQFVLTPLSLQLLCPAVLDFGAPANCSAQVHYNDGSTQVVMPTLSTAPEAVNDVAINGSSIISQWSDRKTGKTLNVLAEHDGLQTSAAIYLNPRKTLLTSLDIVGVSEIVEGGATNFQAWATWDDGSRTEVTASAHWTSSDTNIGDFAANIYGAFTSRYILDQESDKTGTITAWLCPNQADYSSSCPATERISTSVDLTILYRHPNLIGLKVDSSIFPNGLIREWQNTQLRAIAIWDKKRADGKDVVTEVVEGVSWASNNSGISIDGNMLVSSAATNEPLAILTAQYTDPNNSSVIQTARHVFTLYHSQSTASQYLLGDTLLGGDGLARQIQPAYTPSSTPKVNTPDPFIDAVIQKIDLPNDGVAYLRRDGSVWHSVRLKNTGLSQAIQDQLAAQLAGVIEPRIPRPIPGINRMVGLAAPISSINLEGRSAQLFALRDDGTVWAISSQLSFSGEQTYTIRQIAGLADITRLAASHFVLFALKRDGSVWSAGFSWTGTLGYQATASSDSTRFTKVTHDDGADLSDITDIATTWNSVVALDAHGKLWAWGENREGELGLGDTVQRNVATPITTLTDVKSISGGSAYTMAAVKHSDGSIYVWGSGTLQPQHLGTLTNISYLTNHYAVDTAGSVWTWHGSPVMSERPLENQQLVLQ